MKLQSVVHLGNVSAQLP